MLRNVKKCYTKQRFFLALVESYFSWAATDKHEKPMTTVIEMAPL